MSKMLPSGPPPLTDAGFCGKIGSTKPQGYPSTAFSRSVPADGGPFRFELAPSCFGSAPKSGWFCALRRLCLGLCKHLPPCAPSGCRRRLGQMLGGSPSPSATAAYSHFAAPMARMLPRPPQHRRHGGLAGSADAYRRLGAHESKLIAARIPLPFIKRRNFPC